MNCYLCGKEKDYEDLWHITGDLAPENVRGEYVCDECEKQLTVKVDKEEK